MASPEQRDRIVYGVGPVRELVERRPRDVILLWVASAGRGKRRPVDDVAERARRAGISVQEADRERLDSLAGGQNHQGLVAVCGAYQYAELSDLLERAADRCGLLVALDSVSDPHNLGAVVRSAHVFGADGIVIPRDRAAGVTPVVTKVSAGATEYVPIAQVTNLASALGDIKEAGFWTVAVHASDDSRPIWEIDAGDSLCLVLGSEGKGIRPRVAGVCDLSAVIPMATAAVGSLNVSVAAGVALYEISRQRAALAGS